MSLNPSGAMSQEHEFTLLALEKVTDQDCIYTRSKASSDTKGLLEKGLVLSVMAGYVKAIQSILRK